jgi:hypothetical protein
MPSRALKHLCSTTLAVAGLGIATAAAASAQPALPADPSRPASGDPPAVHVAAGTDRATALPPRTGGPATPADKARHGQSRDGATTGPVPQPPTWPENPQPLPPPQPSSSSDPGFQWDDAGIGAGGALVVALTGFGAVAMMRRRHTGALPA